MAEREALISKHGGYRKLKSFQIAQLVYDVTVRFVDRISSNYSEIAANAALVLIGVASSLLDK